MKNADRPAAPLSGNAYDDFAAYDGTSETSYNPECQGLTKREYFAGLAMQGLSLSGDTSSDIAKQSVDLADALLKQLEENK